MLKLQDVTKVYRGSAGKLTALSSISLNIRHAELCAVMGASGSGKSTLMNLLGLLDRPDRGTIVLNGISTARLRDPERAALRNRQIGFIFQAFHLLPRLSALENVALPLLYRGMDRAARLSAAAVALDRVGLANRVAHRPDQLSGGQRQRVAVARALVGAPQLLLADEPTGNLDSQSATEIMNLFLALNRELDVTVVIVTHDPAIAAYCPRRITMRDGRVLDDTGVQRS